MTVNQLLFDHQLAKLCAQHSIRLDDRTVNCDLTGHYAQRITEWRQAKGLSEAGWPQDHRQEGARS